MCAIVYLAYGRRSAVLCSIASHLKPRPPPAEQENDSPKKSQHKQNTTINFCKFDGMGITWIEIVSSSYSALTLSA